MDQNNPQNNFNSMPQNNGMAYTPQQQPGVNPQTGMNPQYGANPQPGMNPQMQPQYGAFQQPDMNPQTQPQYGAFQQPGMNPQTQPQYGAFQQPGINPQMQPQYGAFQQTGVNPQAQPQYAPDYSAYLDSQRSAVASGNIVDISHVRKGYTKNQNVYEDLNLTIPAGKIVGLLGPNGSGKTTLIKMLAGLLAPDAGSISIAGFPVGHLSKAVVSYLPERTYFNEGLKVRSVINMFKDFYADFDEAQAYRMFQQLNIATNAVIKTLSKGTKEKVQLIMVMSRHAKLYLLDEPIAGVDPAAREYILKTILLNRDAAGTLLISTHLIQDIEPILDDVIMVRQGQIVIHQDAASLKASQGKSIDEIFREVFRYVW